MFAPVPFLLCSITVTPKARFVCRGRNSSRQTVHASVLRHDSKGLSASSKRKSCVARSAPRPLPKLRPTKKRRLKGPPPTEKQWTSEPQNPLWWSRHWHGKKPRLKPVTRRQPHPLSQLGKNPI